MKLAILSFILAVLSSTFMVYVATKDDIRKRGISILSLELAGHDKPPDVSSKEENSTEADVFSKIKDMAIETVDHATDEIKEAAQLLSILPKNITVGSEKICWEPSDFMCKTIPSKLSDWFPDPINRIPPIQNPGTALRALLRVSAKSNTCIISLAFILSIISFTLMIRAMARIMERLESALATGKLHHKLAPSLAPVIGFWKQPHDRFSEKDIKSGGDHRSWITLALGTAISCVILLTLLLMLVIYKTQLALRDAAREFPGGLKLNVKDGNLVLWLSAEGAAMLLLLTGFCIEIQQRRVRPRINSLPGGSVSKHVK